MRIWSVLVPALLLFDSARTETIPMGLYYDVAHDGHGFDLHKQGNHYILYFYTYDNRGDPEWFVGLGRMNDGAVQGELLRFRYDPSSSPPQTRDGGFEGSFSLDWRDLAVEAACENGVNRGDARGVTSFRWRTGAMLDAWCVQSLLGGGDGGDYFGGIWYAGEEDPGYGFSMAQGIGALSAIAYYYDAEGEPRWALGVAPPGEVIDLDHFEGYCRNCFPKNRLVTPAGSLSLTWDTEAGPGSGGDSARLLLAYPIEPFGAFERQFSPLSLSDGEAAAVIEPGEMPPQAFYDTFISDQVIQVGCMDCHHSGGPARGTRLVYARRGTRADYRSFNYGQIREVVAAEGRDYILDKARGLRAHGGGRQLRDLDRRYRHLELLMRATR